MSPRSKRQTGESEYLTPRQIEILTLIRDVRRSCGYSPTLQEIADELGVSKITVFEHVDALLRKRMLTRRSNKARSLHLTGSARLPDERPTVMPLVGRIAAGCPIEAIETPDTLDLEEVFTSRYPVRALTVTGDSMIEEHIRDGDVVVYEERSNARNGDTVVALIAGEEATLKKFYKEKNRIRLQPANKDYRPIYTRNVEIIGVAIGVMRRY
ncbi:MAG: transcriptional repressor LexA [Phycisphaerales bacterium]|nr:MAG: transcriptional repressor LexA [Phycisphaerales bacterium]